MQFRGSGGRRRGAHPLDLQVKRIAAIRRTVGSDFFINARTDLFLKTQTYDDALVAEVIERGKAFADAGASGFFVRDYRSQSRSNASSGSSARGT